MKRLLIVLGLLALAGFGYYYAQTHYGFIPPEPIAQLQESVHGMVEGLQERVQSITIPHPHIPARTAESTEAFLPNQVTLYLQNGGVVTGSLVEETPQKITLRWDYGNVSFRRTEIQRIVRGKQATKEDPLTIPEEEVVEHNTAP